MQQTGIEVRDAAHAEGIVSGLDAEQRRGETDIVHPILRVGEEEKTALTVHFQPQPIKPAAEAPEHFELFHVAIVHFRLHHAGDVRHQRLVRQMAERENGAHLALGLILPLGDGNAKPR